MAKKANAAKAGKFRKVGSASAHRATKRGNHVRDFISGDGARAQAAAASTIAARKKPRTNIKNRRLKKCIQTLEFPNAFSPQKRDEK